VRLLLDQGFDAWGYDPLSTPIAAEDRVRREVPPGPFRLITAIEVIEHLSDPVETLQRLRSLLGPRGLLVLSTELFDQRTHGASWHYLAQEGGQHITLFSRQGLQEAATRAGLRWLTSLRFDGIDFLHLLVPPMTGGSPACVGRHGCSACVITGVRRSPLGAVERSLAEPRYRRRLFVSWPFAGFSSCICSCTANGGRPASG